MNWLIPFVIIIVITLITLITVKLIKDNKTVTNKISKKDVDLIAKNNNIPSIYHKFLTAQDQDKFIFYPDKDHNDIFWFDITLTDEDYKDYAAIAYFPAWPVRFFFIIDGKGYTGIPEEYQDNGNKKFRFAMKDTKILNIPTVKGTFSDIFGYMTEEKK